MEERGRLAEPRPPGEQSLVWGDGKVCKAGRSSLRGLLGAGQTFRAPLTALRCPLLGNYPETSVQAGFEEIGTREGFSNTTLPRTGPFRGTAPKCRDC